MATIAEALALARKEQQAGRFAQAEQICREVVQVAPSQPEAWCFLAAACQAQGKLQEAANNYHEALRLRPTYPDPYFNLGLILRSVGQRDAAIGQFNQAVCANTGFAVAVTQLEAALAEQRELMGPADVHPSDPQTRSLYAQAHYNLGVIRGLEHKPQESIAHYRLSLLFNADDFQSLNNLANALGLQGHWDEAVTFFHQALRCKPDCAEVYLNLGAALTNLGRFDEAEDSFHRALAINPNLTEIRNNLGESIRERGQFDEALSHFEQALETKPAFAEAHWNRALVWLLRGDFERGWPEYEWRWKQPGAARRDFPQPLWDGSPLEGRTILVHAEQGLGDTIQFIRYLGQVRARGGRVIFECQEPLCRLLTGFPGIEVLVPRGFRLPAFDMQVPLASLPGIFRTTVATIPAPIPYLHADPQLVEQWRRELAPLKAFKIGIVWQGSSTYRHDRHRSIPLAHFAPLAKVEGVHLIGLQKGPGAQQVQAHKGQFALHDLAARLLDFTDTAAIIKNLDLVISCDTSVAHLAGALEFPVWIALPFAPDWRWLLKRTDSPWYPTVRLFRQTRFGDWDGVFDRMAGELRAIVK